MVRVRDEYKMALAHYQNLYESSMAFGMRKALQAQYEKESMTSRIQRLEYDCTAQEEEIGNLDQKYEDICKKEEENVERE